MAEKGRKGSTAEEMAKNQRAISIAEFFEKNRHLLGYDSKTKALVTAVREAVDNSLDACSEADILPEITVRLVQLKNANFKMVVKDNGPGIVPEQIPRIFGKLLYGSKFHRLKQSRGQQGIGISGVVLYSQLLTGKPSKIRSSTGDGKTHFYELMLDIVRNEPETISSEVKEESVWSGVEIECEIEGRYVEGKQSVLEFVTETSVANPYAKIIFQGPKGTTTFQRSVDALPEEAEEIKPHPHGVEIGIFRRMLAFTVAKNVVGFLMNDFSKVGRLTAKSICKVAKVDEKAKPAALSHQDSERLWRVVQDTKLNNPATSCLSSIGEVPLRMELEKMFRPEFVTTVTRTPVVYRGIPFAVEAGIAYGGEKINEPNLMRFANKVPLLYRAGECAITSSVSKTDWRRYRLDQPGGKGLPNGPVIIVVHLMSAWVPFSSESKEAIANYDLILKEIKLVLQDCGRNMKRYLSARHRKGEIEKKRKTIERYIPLVASSLNTLTGEDEQEIKESLQSLTGSKFRVSVPGEPREVGSEEKSAPREEEIKESEAKGELSKYVKK